MGDWWGVRTDGSAGVGSRLTPVSFLVFRGVSGLSSRVALRRCQCTEWKREGWDPISLRPHYLSMEERPQWGVLGLKGLGEKPGRVFSPPEGYPPLNLARRGARPRNRSRATGPEAQGQNKMNQACLGAQKSASWTTRGLGKYTFYQTRVFRALQGGPQNT